jgi:hypothetical protein
LWNDKNIIYNKVNGKGRDFYSRAKSAQEEMKKNGIKSPNDFTDIIKDLHNKKNNYYINLNREILLNLLIQKK